MYDNISLRKRDRKHEHNDIECVAIDDSSVTFKLCAKHRLDFIIDIYLV